MLSYRNLKRIFSQKQLSWKEMEYFDPAWKQRIETMAALIPKQSQSVLDLGCGKMWLKDYLLADVHNTTGRYFFCEWLLGIHP